MLEILNGKFPEKSATVCSVFSRENSPFVITVLALRQPWVGLGT